MPNLPTSNNNPGDLRPAGQTNSTQGAGGFASFPTPQDGYAALLNQIQTNINKNPSETLEGFSNSYAPASDGNDPMQYTADLANQLGVAPNTPIGSLQSQIGQFADAISKNEGYQTPEGNTAGAIGATGTAAVNAAGGPVAATALGAGALGVGALGADAAGLGGEALSGIEGIGGDVLGGIQGLLGMNKSSPASSDTTQQSPVYNQVQNLLGSTIGGQAVMQEAQNREVDPIQTLIQSGAVPQPDASGNFDKATPIGTLSDQVAQDKQYQTAALGMMTTPTSLHDVEKSAIEEVTEKMQGSPHMTDAINKVKKTFANYRAQQPKKKDKFGNEYTDTFQVSPTQLQEMKERSAEGENWATPPHERAASQHIYKTMNKRLSEIAKKEKVKGWDETNKRMESKILAIKAIKKMPKKAPRDVKKELLHDVITGLGGAAIGKTLGNGLLGGAAGYILHRRLGDKHYKHTGSKKEQKEIESRAKQKMEGLIHRG